MSDTQWPRYEVFKQDRPGKPHESVGTVHAVDAEMALQNGRDVFARRPKCHSLWVVRADAIYSKTAQALADDNSWRENLQTDGPPQTYLIFQKQTERRGMTFTTHAGQVEAASPAHALSLAIDQFPAEELYVWWVCPAAAVTSSLESDIDSMFVPPMSKKYRLPNQYRTIFTMQKIKRNVETNDAP